MKRLIICLFLSTFPLPPGTFGQQRSLPTDSCQRTRIALSFAPDSKLEVVNHYLAFHPDAEGELYLRNETGSEIKGVTILVNYEDEEGRTIFTIIYQGNVKGSGNTETNVRPFYQLTFPKPIRPGQVFSLFGTNLLTTTRIPARAVASTVNLQLTDTNIVRTGPAPFRSDPILEQTPLDYFQLETTLDDLPQEVLLKLSIDARGTITHVDSASQAESQHQIPASVKDEIRSWRFFPFILDGYARNSELFILLRFQKAGDPPTRECFIGEGSKYPSTFVIVTLAPIPNLKGRWMIFYDRFPARGQFWGQEVLASAPAIAIHD